MVPVRSLVLPSVHSTSSATSVLPIPAGPRLIQILFFSTVTCNGESAGFQQGSAKPATVRHAPGHLLTMISISISRTRPTSSPHRLISPAVPRRGSSRRLKIPRQLRFPNLPGRMIFPTRPQPASRCLTFPHRRE